MYGRMCPEHIPDDMGEQVVDLYLSPQDKECKQGIFWIWTIFKVRLECRKSECIINGAIWRH